MARAPKKPKEVMLDNLVPFEAEVVAGRDRFGFSDLRLYNKNVRELSLAIAGIKTYYVSDSSGGAVTRKLTFTDGVLTAET